VYVISFSFSKATIWNEDSRVMETKEEEINQGKRRLCPREQKEEEEEGCR
jgi:hypothetical protein